MENMVAREGLMEAFDIDPTLAPYVTPQCKYVCSSHFEAIEYNGWIDHTYLHVLPAGRTTAKVDVTLRTVQ